MASPAGGPLLFDEIQTRLRDGTQIVLRPIRPDDKARLAEGLANLSPTSRMRRFMAPVGELTDEQLAYLTEIDYFDHFAWAAVLRDHPDAGIGIGRYVRLPEDPGIAEAAVTVADPYQGKGLGTLLVGVLAATARMAGIERFRAYVLEDNAPMIHLLDELGTELTHDSAGVVRADVPLAAELIPDSPAARALELATVEVRRAVRGGARGGRGPRDGPRRMATRAGPVGPSC
jgi:RimJ/RimL family protein N-acetyltransferase